ncbi:hypothetical protein [Paraburkholderia phenoliruptrix]|uniref:hypothetical protein n=1 Tax=Paraburkholderia phenoliruptrix TaxID=252970 RepID=UPI001C4EAF94|nr:hypothetical protein [Paraburkholderia phenoliruptrix]MBW0450843.1 hypothetical protein [Paraburkholderia phenoliruptrix]MBW9100936.1 hypothetical protein [Paraburkholderia phenoliruptrix]
MLTKEQIFAARDLQTEDVDVPEWGGAVRVSVMSGKTREALMEVLQEPQATSRFQALMLASTIVGEDGAPIFCEGDIEKLRDKSPDVLVRLVDVAMRLNKLGAKSVDDAEKNSEAAQSGSSGSDSHAS